MEILPDKAVEKLKNSLLKKAILQASLNLYDFASTLNKKEDLELINDVYLESFLLLLEKLNYSVDTIQSCKPLDQQSKKHYTYFNLNSHRYIIGQSFISSSHLILINTPKLVLYLIENRILDFSYSKSEYENFETICQFISSLSLESLKSIDGIKLIVQSPQNIIDLTKKISQNMRVGFGELTKIIRYQLKNSANEAVENLMQKGDETYLLKLIRSYPEYFLKDRNGIDICSRKKLYEVLPKHFRKIANHKLALRENIEDKVELNPAELEIIKTSFLYLVAWFKKYKISPIAKISLIEIVRAKDYTIEFKQELKNFLSLNYYYTSLIEIINEDSELRTQFSNLIDFYLKALLEVKNQFKIEIEAYPNTVIEEIQKRTNLIINREIKPRAISESAFHYINSLYSLTENDFPFPKETWKNIYTELFKFYTIRVIVSVCDYGLTELPSQRNINRYFDKIRGEVNYDIYNLYEEYKLVFEARNVLDLLNRQEISEPSVINFINKISSPDFDQDDYQFCSDLLYEIRLNWLQKTTIPRNHFCPDK